MAEPRIEIKYVDAIDHEGYLSTVLNGFLQPSIRMGFTPGNDANTHTGLRDLIEAVYARGFRDGERESKNRVNELIDWAKSR